jgi:chromosome partitioning protein
MEVFSVITQKGGVGKTTTSIHLGASLVELEYKVLLIDFDAQRNLSIGYKINRNIQYTVKDFLQGNLDNFTLTEKQENLFILAGDRNLENIKLQKNQLKDSLNKIESLKFDYVIIDCPPRPITTNLGLGEIALIASDYVISPIEAEEYSIEGINELLPSINRVKIESNNKLIFLGFFFNKVVENTLKFRKYRSIAKEEAKSNFFNNYIRQDVAIEKAKSLGETVYKTAPSSRVAEDYKNLINEILKKIK